MLKVDVDGACMRLTMDRPELRNALGAEIVNGISDALDRAESESSVRVIVLTGAGSVFSAGADLSSMRSQGAASLEDNRRNALEMGALFHRIYDFPKPVVARVPGPAIGGGVGLMASCDVIVAAESAFFAFSEVRLGIVPALISPFCVRRLGVAAAKRLFLTGQRISAADARAVGLVDEVAPDAELDQATSRVTGWLTEGGPEALAEAKRLIASITGMTMEAALPFTADTLARVRASAEAREGVSAFLEKRPPSWSTKRS